MEIFKGLDLGVYSSFRVAAQQNPEILPIMRAADWVGEFGWIALLVLLVGRWWSQRERYSATFLVKVFAILAVVEAIRWILDRPRPDDAQDYLGTIVGHGFPNGPTFRVVFLAWLLWETLPSGKAIRVLGALIAALFCVWVIVGQLFLHLGFLSDILASLAGGMGLGLLLPRWGRRQAEA